MPEKTIRASLNDLYRAAEYNAFGNTDTRQEDINEALAEIKGILRKKIGELRGYGFDEDSYYDQNEVRKLIEEMT